MNFKWIYSKKQSTFCALRGSLLFFLSRISLWGGCEISSEKNTETLIICTSGQALEKMSDAELPPLLLLLCHLLLHAVDILPEGSSPRVQVAGKVARGFPF